MTLFRYLMGRMASRQCMLAMDLEDIEWEKFDGWVAKHQIRQYFPRQKLRYMVHYILQIYYCELLGILTNVKVYSFQRFPVCTLLYYKYTHLLHKCRYS